jgi:predicted site-specific integrase-resolvase
MPIEKDKLYRLKEASELTNYSISTLRRRIKAGEIRNISRKGQVTKIWGGELIRFLGGLDE